MEPIIIVPSCGNNRRSDPSDMVVRRGWRVRLYRTPVYVQEIGDIGDSCGVENQNGLQGRWDRRSTPYTRKGSSSVKMSLSHWPGDWRGANRHGPIFVHRVDGRIGQLLADYVLFHQVL